MVSTLLAGWGANLRAHCELREPESPRELGACLDSRGTIDMLGHWNRGYGRRGFAQYQFVIPFEDGEARMRTILSAILASGELPFLNILKRLGQQSGGLLSFPREGYTFAIDLPIRDRTVELLHRLDRMVVEVGGRIYLGKDGYVEPATFRAMYPALESWLAIKRRYDPTNVFTSNLARRVGLLS